MGLVWGDESSPVTCCQKEPDKSLSQDKPEITNYKHQIANKLQITTSKSKKD